MGEGNNNKEKESINLGVAGKACGERTWSGRKKEREEGNDVWLCLNSSLKFIFKKIRKDKILFKH